VDSAGNVYVTDTGNDTIRKITPAAVVTTLAGTAGQVGSTDGTGSAARFNGPDGLAVDSAGNLYVAEFFNDTIRKVTPAGVVTTLAGTAGQLGSTDGTGSAARFSSPEEVAVDAAGNLYVADAGNDTVRKLSIASVLAQTGLTGTSAVPANVALSGLSPSTTYYDRVVASSSAGTTLGSILSFTTPALATLTLSNLTQTYSGMPEAVTVTTSPAGLSGVSVTYNGSSTAPTNAGSYAVVASLSNANYTASNATARSSSLRQCLHSAT